MDTWIVSYAFDQFVFYLKNDGINDVADKNMSADSCLPQKKLLDGCQNRSVFIEFMNFSIAWPSKKTLWPISNDVHKLCVQDRERVYVMFIDLMANFDISKGKRTTHDV